MPEEVERLQGLYGSLDVLAECKKAYAWVTSSYLNRKTYGGMLTFLTNWLNKSANQFRGRQDFSPRSPRQATPRVSELISKLGNNKTGMQAAQLEDRSNG
jgi:hypothetical protein